MTSERAATSSSVGEQVYKKLRDAVIANRYPPGKPLRQEALAAELGVSRVPVRAALQRLEAEGLIQTLDRRGAVVRTHSAAEVQELCRLRAVLETYAMRESMRTMSPERLDRLRGLLAAADERSTTVVDPRAEYYRELYDAEHNPELHKMLEELRRRLGRYLHGWHRTGSHAEGHHDLIHAVASGDEEEAVRLVHENLDQIRRAILARFGVPEPERLRAVPRSRGHNGELGSSVPPAPTRGDGLDDLAGDLATCSRLLAFQGLIDYSGHVSARIPGRAAMLIQPRDASRAALTGTDMLVVAFDGTVLDGDGVPPVEWPIHAGAYLARPDAAFACHGHPPASTSFTMTDRPLLPVRHFAYKHPDGPAVHPDPTHIVTMEQGHALAATLGDAGACLIRAHGTLVVAPTVQELFMDCLDLEENARTLLDATAAGGTLLPLTPEEIERVAASYGRSGHRPNKVWEHYLHRGRAAGVV